MTLFLIPINIFNIRGDFSVDRLEIIVYDTKKYTKSVDGKKNVGTFSESCRLV